jgi:hypothetical protein
MTLSVFLSARESEFSRITHILSGNYVELHIFDANWGKRFHHLQS